MGQRPGSAGAHNLAGRAHRLGRLDAVVVAALGEKQTGIGATTSSAGHPLAQAKMIHTYMANQPSHGRPTCSYARRQLLASPSAR
jgi:hypothetical protein